MLKILPQLFYETPEVKKILVDRLSCIVHKELSEPVLHKEGYVSAHAITLVLRGHLNVENECGWYTEVPAGKMIFLPKGLYTISDIVPKDGHFEAVVFFFDQEVLADFIASIDLKCSRQKCVPHMILDYTESLRIFTEATLGLYKENEKPHRNLTRMKLFEFLHLIAASEQGKSFLMALSTLNNKERRGLREFMNANYTKPLSIEDYAYLTGRSLSTFRRDFKTKFGISPKQWLINKRLEKAYELLGQNSISTISQVAFACGYENIPHFIKAFHEKYGITPKQLLIQERNAVLV